MKKHQPSPSAPFDPSELYAKVNKQNRGQRQTRSAEEVRTESPYAPQNPPTDANPYSRPRSEPTLRKRVDPYAIKDLSEDNWRTSLQEPPELGAVGGRAPHQQESLYADLDFSGSGGRQPRPKSEHLYAEVDPRGGRHPERPIDSVYATLGMGSGGPGADHRENPIYQGPESRKRTSPPQTEKDLITSMLLKNTDFQYGASEIQVWCATVYGNQHALNPQLARILDDPSKGREILQDLMQNPEGPGKLAGQKILGVKSPARRDAEDGFGPLCAALERHVHVAEKLHKNLTREHRQDRGVEREKESPERQARHQHHERHHRQGREQDSPQQERQPRGRQQGGGMAFAM